MLNTEHFTVLAGNPAKWDAESAALPDRGGSLVRLQVEQANRGYLSATLVESMYGWGVRYGSGLQGFGILLSGRGGVSRAEAIAWGTVWANKDPENREFYARKSDLAKSDRWEPVVSAAGPVVHWR